MSRADCTQTAGHNPVQGSHRAHTHAGGAWLIAPCLPGRPQAAATGRLLRLVAVPYLLRLLWLLRLLRSVLPAVLTRRVAADGSAVTLRRRGQLQRGLRFSVCLSTSGRRDLCCHALLAVPTRRHHVGTGWEGGNEGGSEGGSDVCRSMLCDEVCNSTFFAFDWCAATSASIWKKSRSPSSSSIVALSMRLSALCARPAGFDS